MNVSNENRSSQFDFRRFFQICRTRWYWFAISAVVCSAVGAFYALNTVPIFQVVANILISDEDGGSSNAMNEFASQFSMGNMMGGSSSVDDEINMVRSHSNLRQTAKDFGLNTSYTLKRFGGLVGRDVFDKTPVAMSCNPAIGDTIKAWMLFKVSVDKDHKVDIQAKVDKKKISEIKDASFPVTMSTPYGEFTFNKTQYLRKGQGAKMDIGFGSYDGAAEALGELVTIYIPSKKANVISFSVESHNPDFSRKVLDRIIENYNMAGIEEKQKKDQKTAEFVNERLNVITQELNLSESDIENYKRSNDLTDVGADAGKWMARTNGLESQIMGLETEIHLLGMTRDFINDPKNKGQLVPELNVGAGIPLKEFNGLILQKMSLEVNAKGNNAALKQLDEQIGALRENMKVSLQKAYENSLARLQDLKKQVKISKSHLDLFPMHERQFGNIKRQQEIKEELFLFLLKKQEETNIALANSMPRAKIIDEAYSLSEPINLSKKKIVAIAFLIGLFLPFAVIMFLEKIKNKFETTGELEMLTSVPILGEVCKKSNAESPLVVKADGGSTSVAELFRLIRTNLQFVLGSTGSKVVLMTSTISGEGKSFVSINLASSLALLGKKTLLMGLDIRNPKLAEYLSLPQSVGFTRYISDENVSLDSIIMRAPLEKNMDIIMAGPIPPNPSELLQSSRVDELFAKLREMYDYIIVDSAPVGMVSDSFTLDRVADATVYVTRANYTTHKEIRFVNKLYAEKRLPKMTLILNGTKASAGYGYGYGQSNKK